MTDVINLDDARKKKGHNGSRIDRAWAVMHVAIKELRDLRVSDAEISDFLMYVAGCNREGDDFL
jgi:hypothetical protein